ncbi:MAG: ATP-binding cassette domain-containing protein [Eubacteriales bacterium]|nr:ATP-binding cassette domain-containing protein [Eubacteriales bacterium]
MSISVHIKKKLKNFELSVDFDMEQCCVGMLGASGCGKSITLKCIAGIETPDSGKIVLNGRVLFDSETRTNLSPQKRKVGYMFQQYALFPNMTVFQNVEAGLSGSQRKFAGKKERREYVTQLLEQFFVSDLADSLPSRLSGGQQQRVALARIVASEPEVLLLDEPFSAMDSYLREQLMQEMRGFLGEYGKDVIMVSHSRDEVYQMCEKTIIMREGGTEIVGRTEELFKNPQTVLAARLTGCKNLSRAERLDARTVYASDWNMKLTVGSEVEEDVAWVGIRAHDFMREDEAGKQESFYPGNVMGCRLERMTEAPFEVYLTVNNIEAKKKASALWWKISKKEWEDMGKNVPGRIYFPPERLILLRN